MPNYTKLFFFYREALVPDKQTFLILDKWLSMAWCAIDGSMNQNTQVFDIYYQPPTNAWFDGILKRKKPEAYEKYLKFMNDVNKKYENAGGLIKLEEKFFGIDLRLNYQENPRLLYRNWASNQGMPLKDPKPKSKAKKSKKKKVVKEDSSKKPPSSFYLNTKPAGYIGLTVHPSESKKEGYIDNDGWLCVSEHLRSLLHSYDLRWEEGNTGGSKEKYKTKFKNQEEGIEFLNKIGLIE
jgi:hypothetical protein